MYEAKREGAKCGREIKRGRRTGVFGSFADRFSDWRYFCIFGDGKTKPGDYERAQPGAGE